MFFKMMTKQELLKLQILKILETTPFQNDEGKNVEAKVETINYFDKEEVGYVWIEDISSSRHSAMYRSNGHWKFNRNFWLTQNNLKLINEIERVIKLNEKNRWEIK